MNKKISVRENSPAFSGNKRPYDENYSPISDGTTESKRAKTIQDEKFWIAELRRDSITRGNCFQLCNKTIKRFLTESFGDSLIPEIQQSQNKMLNLIYGLNEQYGLKYIKLEEITGRNIPFLIFYLTIQNSNIGHVFTYNGYNQTLVDSNLNNGKTIRNIEFISIQQLLNAYNNVWPLANSYVFTLSEPKSKPSTH